MIAKSLALAQAAVAESHRLAREANERRARRESRSQYAMARQVSEARIEAAVKWFDDNGKWPIINGVEYKLLNGSPYETIRKDRANTFKEQRDWSPFVARAVALYNTSEISEGAYLSYRICRRTLVPRIFQYIEHCEALQPFQLLLIKFMDFHDGKYSNLPACSFFQSLLLLTA